MLYRDAAVFMNDGPGTLRTRIYSKMERNRAKQVHALVAETLRHASMLRAVVEASGLLAAERQLSENIALLMVHDLLLSREKRIRCARCKEKLAVLKHKTRLHAEFVRYRLRHGAITDALPGSPVRWVRCNTALCTTAEVEDVFAKGGLQAAATFPPLKTTYYVDTYIPGLYALSPDFAVTKLPLYSSGGIIIQDRASCIPVVLLNPDSSHVYMDSCAAPGNKTTQLAANAKFVHAFERDSNRALVLQKMVKKAGLGDRVEVHQCDFTQSDPSKFTIKGIIVDPSCSGSGTFGRLDQFQEVGDANNNLESRLAKLAEFQYKIMLHAMQFDAETIVYSTCSIYDQENEDVVCRLLKTPEVSQKWRLAPRNKALPAWPVRGKEHAFRGMSNASSLANSCIRVRPIADGGIGFFAVCFERCA